MSTVISVENLGKKYTLHHQQREPYTSLRDVLTQGCVNLEKRVASVFTRNSFSYSHSQMLEDFWALKDVSFEVKQGDRIGIIGRNGAGKSTLLKILSRIAEPTTGCVKIKGRVASLLEVGTGFHPELTGRENIYLNGAILGMRRAEINRKFDEIVDFAEIERFLDTPVKRYSSGMYVRLAFAVAAHLEPEILVVDEVLAVGDLQFQKKCLGKMEDVATREGRTVLFVSHNMEVIRALCNFGIMLEHGEVRQRGDIVDTVMSYSNSLKFRSIDEHTSIAHEKFRRGSGAVRFSEVKILNSDLHESQIFTPGESVRLLLSYKCLIEVPELYVNVSLKSGQLNETVTSVYHQISKKIIKVGQNGLVEIEIDTTSFRAKEYNIYLWLGNSYRQPYDVLDGLVGPLLIKTNNSQMSDTVIEEPGYFNIKSVCNILK